jgi:hypothetical protein
MWLRPMTVPEAAFLRSVLPCGHMVYTCGGSRSPPPREAGFVCHVAQDLWWHLSSASPRGWPLGCHVAQAYGDTLTLPPQEMVSHAAMCLRSVAAPWLLLPKRRAPVQPRD